MPELPEVETVARGLAAVLPGRTFIGVKVGWPRTVAFPSPEDLKRQIAGRRVVSVGRRGKYVVLTLDEGYLLVHLKMSGRLMVVPSDAPPDPYAHTLFALDNGQQLRFRDVRKFGRVYLVDDPLQITGSLGPEPLAKDFTLDDFRHLLERRTGRLKSLLLNQEFLAGLGNIYADEALFVARLHPLRRANTLSVDDQARLYNAIRDVLDRAIAGRGTTLDDSGYVDANGQAGEYQSKIAVYGRTGEPCLVCQTAISRLVVGGRSTHFCPTCQILEQSEPPDHPISAA
jgi:formamidopyrimidine-DNA glycosylase